MQQEKGHVRIFAEPDMSPDSLLAAEYIYYVEESTKIDLTFILRDEKDNGMECTVAVYIQKPGRDPNHVFTGVNGTVVDIDTGEIPKELKGKVHKIVLDKLKRSGYDVPKKLPVSPKQK